MAAVIASPPVDRLAVRTYVGPLDPVTIREALLREHYRGGQSFYVVPRIADLAEKLGTTRTAAALEYWREDLDGAVVAIGNAPTALFALLEMIDAGIEHQHGLEAIGIEHGRGGLGR